MVCSQISCDWKIMIRKMGILIRRTRRSLQIAAGHRRQASITSSPSRNGIGIRRKRRWWNSHEYHRLVARCTIRQQMRSEVRAEQSTDKTTPRRFSNILALSGLQNSIIVSRQNSVYCTWQDWVNVAFDMCLELFDHTHTDLKHFV